MPARFRIASPAATSAPPIQLARIGFPSSFANGFNRSAISVGLGHPLRSQNHEQAVARRVLRGDLDGFGVALGPGVADDIDGVLMAPVRRQDLVESRPWSRAKARRAAPPSVSSASVASTPGPPALVTNREPGPARARLLGEGFGHVEQIGRCVSTRRTPQRRKAASSTSSLPVSEPVCDAAAFAAACGASGLDHDDRLRQRHLARGGKEGSRVADRSPCR